MLEGKKNNLQAHTRKKKKFIVNQGVEKKFHDQTKSPTPPPPLRSQMVGPLPDPVISLSQTYSRPDNLF